MGDFEMGRIAATDRRSYAVCNRTLYYWGSVFTYQNTIQTDSAQLLHLTPESVLFEDCHVVVAQGSHLLLTSIDNSLWGYGSNLFGALGIGNDIEFSEEPLCNASISDVIHLTTNIHATSLAIDKDGIVYGWGFDGPYKVLSGGESEIQANGVLFPVEMSFLPPNVRQVEMGREHGLALDEEGRVWIWGKQEDSLNRFNNVGIVTIDGLEDVVMISAGKDFSLAICKDGTIWSWGNNSSGQLGDGTNLSKAKPSRLGLENAIYADAGFNHSLAVDEEGFVWSWGENTDGQLGNGSSVDSLVPQRVLNVFDIVEVKCGLTHSIAMDRKGHVWTWGGNNFGQLGTGDMKASLIPVQVK